MQKSLFTCNYCGKDTSEVDYDYLVGFNHLSCALEAEQKQKPESNPIEKCVLCGTDTQYRFHDHVDMRIGYVEGCGQMCSKCYNKGTDRRHLAVPMSTIYDTPNDAELGSKIRQLYWENQ